MRPAARLQAAIAVLADWSAGTGGLDRALLRWGRAHRFAGAKDRRAIADIVYDVARRARSLQWIGQGGDPGDDLARLDPRRAVLAAARLVDPAALDDLGTRHAPAALSPEEARALDGLDARTAAERLERAPRGVRLDLPDWLLARLGHVPEAGLAALAERAPLDLRVNRLKATREAVAARLAAEGIETVPAPAMAPDGLRVVEGARRVEASAAYAEGLVEIQDASSQAAAVFAAPRPGEAILDYCAGGGGKILALAALADGRGRFVAHDADPGRMDDLPARAARAGVAVASASGARLDAGDAGRGFDLVFADAPCSGSGTWRRNPDAKWRLGPARLDALAALQDRVLDAAARHVRPGGRLIVATCSMLPEETDARVDGFLGRAAAFAEGAQRRLRLVPGRDGGDGFFAAWLDRHPDA